MYLRCVRELFKENRLIRGQFESLGERVNLARITCPLALVVGKKDHITPPAQVWAAKSVVSSQEILEVETPGGHIGSFMGSEELKEQWPGIIEWLLEKERHKQHGDTEQ
jgi:poly(3-hydroxyalkanoate) synthetase